MKSPFSFQFLRCGVAGCLVMAGVAPTVSAQTQHSSTRSVVRPVYDQWTTYLNARFGYQVPVPPGLQAQTDPRKGGSCRFASDDGTLVLKVWGTTLTPQSGDALEVPWREALNLRGRRIDYQRRTSAGFALAGLNGDGSAFYEKVVLSSGVTAGMNVSYPLVRSNRYAPMLAEIERGFGWRPTPAALVRTGDPPPPRGFFSGIRDYFTGESGEVDLYRNERVEEGPAGRPEVGRDPDLSRDPNQTKIDLTPPPAKPRGDLSAPPLEKSQSATPPPPADAKPVPAKREDLPYGISIPGKKGYVYSPYGESKQQVDVTDIPTGTKVKCPYTGKIFRVP